MRFADTSNWLNYSDESAQTASRNRSSINIKFKCQVTSFDLPAQPHKFTWRRGGLIRESFESGLRDARLDVGSVRA